MTVSSYRVSERGQMALPAEARADAGTEPVAVPSRSQTWVMCWLIVPAGRGGLRALVRAAIDDAGGDQTLVAAAAAEEPELA